MDRPVRCLFAIVGLIAGVAVLVAAPWTGANRVQAQEASADTERIVVTGSRISRNIPGVTLTRRADFLLLEVRLRNDALEQARRIAELRATLDNLLAAAAREPLIDVSLIDQDGYVLALDPNALRVAITEDRTRRDTSLLSVRLKTAIPTGPVSAQDLVGRLRAFADRIERVGRTVVGVSGDIEISIVNPGQYRRRLIAMVAEDLTFMREMLGEGSVPQIFGLSEPVAWFRAGSIDVTLYVPYDIVFVPDTLKSFTYFGSN